MVKHLKHNPQILNEREFEKVFKLYFQQLCYYANSFVKDLDSAREIVHDVFINVWNKRDNIIADKALKSYLYTSVHNRCLNFIRDNKKFNRSIERLEDLNPDQYANESDILITEEIKEKIRETLEQLPERAREIFELSRFEGLKYNEIAERLDISVKTVEANMSKALRLFRQNLKDYLIIILLIINIVLWLKKMK